MIRIEPEAWSAMLAHAAEAYPDECCGALIGTADLPRLNERLREALDHAYERAMANARNKDASRMRFGALGSALYDMTLAPIDVRQELIVQDARVLDLPSGADPWRELAHLLFPEAGR